MRMLQAVVAAVVALALGFFAETARADQAFVCDGGRIVYANGRNIEELKRRDPCIAAHFGLRVEAEPAAPAVESRAAVQDAVVRAIDRRTEPGSSRSQPPAGAEPVAVGLVARVVAVSPPAGKVGPAPSPGDSAFIVEPDAPSDYRQVRLLNPQPGAARYFQHRR